jgi:hypothetical protein
MESELTDLSSLKADRFKANAHVLARFATVFAEKTSMKKHNYTLCPGSAGNRLITI